MYPKNLKDVENPSVMRVLMRPKQEETMSLAAIKRRVQVGSKLQIVRHDWPMLRLHGETDEQYKAKQDKFFAVREVVAVKGSEVGFQTGERVSWLSWPKADSIRETSNGFQVDLNGNGLFASIMEYEYR